MAKNLMELLEEEVNNYESIEELRETFIKNGYLEKDIDEALSKVTKEAEKISTIRIKAIKIFTSKEILDRIGYGFVTYQFINILFYLIGAGYFFIGLFNGLKAIFSILISSFMQEYSKMHDLSKGFISKTGIIFGFSFLLMAAAIKLRLIWLFALSLLVGSIGVVTYGDFYSKLIRETIKKERMSHFLVRISYYGILITAAGLLVSGFLMDRFPIDGPVVKIFGARYPVFGYLVSFEISAFAFILSGYFLNFLDYQPQEKKYRFSKFLGEFLSRLREHSKTFVKNKHIFMISVITILLGVVQILGNSYYGIFIYKNFKNVGFGGFMNVAIIFTVALLVSFIGPSLTKGIKRTIGLSPMIVFGILLTALMPFTLVYNPNLVAITVANAVSIMGAVISGVALGMLIQKIMNEKERKMYYVSISMFSIIPFLGLIPIGAFLAQTFGIEFLFKGLAIIIAFIIMPLSLILVGMTHKHKHLIY